MAKPKFSVGDVIRYSSGPTALMRVSNVSENHGGYEHRYYGQQCLGGIVGAYESDCSPATEDDKKEWDRCGRVGYGRKVPWKKFMERYSDQGVVGAYED